MPWIQTALAIFVLFFISIAALFEGEDKISKGITMSLLLVDLTDLCYQFIFLDVTLLECFMPPLPLTLLPLNSGSSS